MPVLCSMLQSTYYAENYAGIIGAGLLLNAQYAHCTYAVQCLLHGCCSTFNMLSVCALQKKIKNAIYQMSNKCMYDAECSICLLGMCMLECPLLASAVCLVCAHAKKVNLGKLGAVNTRIMLEAL